VSYNPRISHRNYNFLCRYWNRLNSSVAYGQNEKLLYPETQSGLFYAKQVDAEGRESEIFNSQMAFPYGTIVIETPDYVSLNKYDKVEFNNKMWIVEDTKKNLDLKSTKFMVNGGNYKTLIALRGN
jgi:hypothetical protein